MQRLDEIYLLFANSVVSAGDAIFFRLTTTLQGEKLDDGLRLTNRGAVTRLDEINIVFAKSLLWAEHGLFFRLTSRLRGHQLDEANRPKKRLFG